MASPTLNAVVIGIGLGLGAVVGAVGVAAYQLTRRKAATALTTALAGAACTFVITWWLLRDDSERADSLIMTTIGGAVLGLLCVLATLLVLRADVPTDLEDEQR